MSATAMFVADQHQHAVNTAAGCGRMWLVGVSLGMIHLQNRKIVWDSVRKLPHDNHKINLSMS